jgi:tetratricopeptide (TPR) repeat protein
MKSINYLEQAKLADSLGKYKLADSFYEKAVRLAATPPTGPIFTEIADLALREAAELALQAALRSGDEAAIRQALRDRGFTEAGIEALEKAKGSLSRVNITNVNTAIAESAEGAFERAANQIKIGTGYTKLDSSYNLHQLENFLREELSPRDRQTLIKFIRKYLNRKHGETISDEFAREINHNGIDYTKPRPEPTRTPRPTETPETPETPEAPTETPEAPIEGVPEEEAGEGIFKRLFRKTPPNAAQKKSKLIKWAKGLSAAALLTFGLILAKDKLYHSESGKEIDYGNPDWNRLGLPDYKMYNDRMEAGQQKAQEPKALAFIEKHKDNPAIKDQRDWYNLALQESEKEGNDPKTVKNFANDVIAIIKKSPLTHGFNADRNAPKN